MNDTHDNTTVHEHHLRVHVITSHAAEGRCNRMNLDIRPWFYLLRAAATRQEGQTMAEYGVVLGLITLAVVGVITLLGSQISTKLNAVYSALGG